MNTRTRTLYVAAFLLIAGLSPVLACASGIATHLLASEQAAELVEDSDLRTLLTRFPDALRSSTSFPDGGYPLNYRWGEASHWAPFSEAYINRVKKRCLNQYLTNNYCGKLALHLLGSVGHGFQDQVTDALLLPVIAQMDGSADSADQDIDFFVLADYPGRQQSIPKRWFIPFLELYLTFKDMGLGSVNPVELFVGGSLIRAGMIGEFFIYPLAAAEGTRRIPWGRANYITHPGGVDQMAMTTARLYDYLWDRLNEQDTQKRAYLTPFPAPDAAVPFDQPKTQAQIGVIADRAIIPASVSLESFRVTDSFGNPISGRFNMRASLDSNQAQSHLIIFYPDSLEPNQTYTVTLTDRLMDETGIPLVSEDGFSWSFHTY